MESFNKDQAEKHLNKLLTKHKIKVIKWSVGSNGRAWFKRNEIKIPRPTNVDRFCVGMHEIKHILDGRKGRLFEREYACEMFAIDQATALGFDASEYQERARRYIIMNIAKGHCRKLNLSTISAEIKKFCNVDFKKWEGKRVFVKGWGGATYKGKPLEIHISN